MMRIAAGGNHEPHFEYLFPHRVTYRDRFYLEHHGQAGLLGDHSWFWADSSASGREDSRCHDSEPRWHLHHAPRCGLVPAGIQPRKAEDHHAKAWRSRRIDNRTVRDGQEGYQWSPQHAQHRLPLRPVTRATRATKDPSLTDGVLFLFLSEEFFLYSEAIFQEEIIFLL